MVIDQGAAATNTAGAVQDLLAQVLASPTTDHPLALQGDHWIGDGGERYEVRDGIVRAVESEAFAESFGFQWNRFEVRQPAEDESTFEVKTGVRLEELKGLRVLDAGCGGGRYCRVAAEAGALVVGVDRSLAVEKARALCEGTGTVALIQADLTKLPLREDAFDLVFSIGVLHHGPSTYASLASIARRVRPGGRLTVWLYRRNWLIQEWLNDWLRARARRMPREQLLEWCRFGARLGAVPIVNQTLNKVVNFSNHPVEELRICDNFDWYSPEYQHHHTPAEVIRWFRDLGFRDVRLLEPAKRGRLYRAAWRAGLIIGSGVNVSGIRNS